MLKSGTDFREFSVVTLELPGGDEDGADGDADGGDNGGDAQPQQQQLEQQQQQQQQQQQLEQDQQQQPAGADERSAKRPRKASAAGAATATAADARADRPCVVSVRRVEVAADGPEDAGAAAVVADFSAQMGSKMDAVIGATAVDLDGRFETVRRRESNLGNFMADLLRRATCADVALLNGGTFRSDAIHRAGDLTLRDLFSILPMLDETVVIEPTGGELLAALENGVSQWPALEGRFLQVSGLTFAFDPRRPKGARVVPGSAAVAGVPLDLKRRYKVATKAFVHAGKDGFDALSVRLGVVCCHLEEAGNSPRLAEQRPILTPPLSLMHTTLNQTPRCTNINNTKHENNRPRRCSSTPRTA